MVRSFENEKWILRASIIARQLELEGVNRMLSSRRNALGQTLPEEDMQATGLQRLFLCVELACLMAIVESTSEQHARVLFFPQRKAIALHVGTDICLNITGVPEEFIIVLSRWAYRYMQSLDYEMLDTQMVCNSPDLVRRLPNIF